MQGSRHVFRIGTVLRHIVRPRMAVSYSQSTAGIIVIGDEIIKGQTADTNSHFICKHLFSLGVKVKKISVIGDDLEGIATEVSQFSKIYTYVITSGGIGPTHDDRTFEAVAKAFNVPVIPHPELVEIIKNYFGIDDFASPKMKMAFVPKSSKLQYGEDKSTGEKTFFPLVSINNVYMFPGVPSQLERAFVLLGDLFKNPDVEFHTRCIYINKDEMTIAPFLNQIDKKFKKHVLLGSYPDMNNSYYKVMVTLESLSHDHLNDAYECLQQVLPEESIVIYEKDPIGKAVSQLRSIVESPDQNSYAKNVRNAVSVVEECLEKFKLEEICVGFNGGKDCTVLLHIFYAVVKRKYPDYSKKLKSLYIRSKLPFPEVEKFIQVYRDRYNLEMLHFDGRIKDCLHDLHEQHPEIKAVVMGTRHTDPYSDHLQPFSMTDPDWPQFMRVNPLLEWMYHDVWKFLRSFSLPYCSLYDRGYTSLGSMNNTHPNPSLQYIDKRGIVCYKPAYELNDSHKERDGRNT